MIQYQSQFQFLSAKASISHHPHSHSFTRTHAGGEEREERDTYGEREILRERMRDKNIVRVFERERKRDRERY